MLLSLDGMGIGSGNRRGIALDGQGYVGQPSEHRRLAGSPGFGDDKGEALRNGCLGRRLCRLGRRLSLRGLRGSVERKAQFHVGGRPEGERCLHRYLQGRQRGRVQLQKKRWRGQEEMAGQKWAR